MVTITKASQRQNLFESVYDELKAYATAGSYGTSSQPTVTAAYIDSEDSLPQIVINRVNNKKEDPVFDRSNTTNNLVIPINVYAKKNKNIDILSDNIEAYLYTKKFTGVTMSDWSEEDDIYITNDNKIRSKTITVVYKNRK